MGKLLKQIQPGPKDRVPRTLETRGVKFKRPFSTINYPLSTTLPPSALSNRIAAQLYRPSSLSTRATVRLHSCRAEKKNSESRKKTGSDSRARRARADSDGTKPSRDSRRTLDDAPELPPLARLIHSLRESKIRFQIAGMTAAILQGTPATTLDTDIWIDLPERQYVRILAICQELGSQILAQTVVALKDDTLVNFIYRVDGLASFSTEYRRAKKMSWLGLRVAVLPLQSILKSKKFVKRPKDLAHIPLLEQTIAASQIERDSY